jgi:ribosomal protein S18 acetylase RimI-like enzyme
METKIFDNKKIKIREISKGDLKNGKKFQNFINSLVKEDAMIKMNRKQSLREETEWLRGKLKQIKNKKEVALIAEYKDKIVGNTQIGLDWGRQSHIGDFGISIRKGYRNIGLGTYLAKEVIKLAKNKLRPRPKIIRLSAYATNKPAIEFYKNLGFKEVARIPKQGKIKGKLVAEVIMLLEL